MEKIFLRYQLVDWCEKAFSIILVLITLSGCKVTGGEDQLSVNTTLNSFSATGLISSDCANEARVDEPSYGCKLSFDIDPKNEFGFWQFTTKNTCNWLSIGAGTGSIAGQPLLSNFGSCLLSAHYVNSSDSEIAAEIDIAINVLNSHYSISQYCGRQTNATQPTLSCFTIVNSTTLPADIKSILFDPSTHTCTNFTPYQILDNAGSTTTTQTNQSSCILGIEIILQSGRVIKISDFINVSDYF